MRSLRKNQKKMKYALQIGEAPKYKTDLEGNILYETYIDEEGNEFPLLDENGNKIPFETGETEILYSEPREFMSSISTSNEEAQTVEYGLSTADFEAILIYPNGSVPLIEGALIWTKSEVKYKYSEELEIKTDMGIAKGRFPIHTSADYMVVRVTENLNFTKAILKSVNK